MMGHRQVEQAALFYEFSLDKHIPADHLLRSIDRFAEFGEVRRELTPFYSSMGRPSVDPELMIRMLIIGYCFGIRSERRLCEEVHLNLAYRWFYGIGLDGQSARSLRLHQSKNLLQPRDDITGLQKVLLLSDVAREDSGDGICQCARLCDLLRLIV